MKKSILLGLCMLMFLTITWAQKPLTHKMKFYVSADGKLYANRMQPLYFYVSDKPGNKGDIHQLKSDSTSAYANPMYLDTEGYNSFRSPSAVDTVTKEIHYPLTDVIYDMYADGIAPDVKLETGELKKSTQRGKLYIGGSASFILTASDNGSGLEQILASIDSAEFKKYGDPINFDSENLHQLAYYAVDNVGNVSEIKKIKFYIDRTAPLTNISFDGEKFENVLSGQSKIILEANDELSGLNQILYSIDKKPYQRYYHSINTVTIAEGDHTLSYYAVDEVNNREVEKEYSFFVDKTPPLLVDEIMGNSFMVNGREYSSGRSKLKLTAMDNKAGLREIKYAINDGDYETYTAPFYLTTVAGSLAVKSYAIDNVGNKSEATEKSTRNQISFVDLTGPQLKYNFTGKIFKTRDTVFVNRETRFVLSSVDPESGLKGLSYSVDEGAEIPYQNPFTIEKDGMHRIFIYGYDNVDNSNREEFTIVVDNTGPVIYSRFSILPIDKKMVDGKQIDVYSNQAVLFLSATDARVAIDRIYYQIGDEPEKMFTGMIEGFKLGKNYKIKVRALDKLGNESTEIVEFATDNTGPQIFTRFSINPTGSEMVDNQPVDVYPAHVSLFLSVTNSYVAYDKIYYSINGGAERTYQGIIDGFKPGTKVKMKIRAIDRLGNQTEKEILFMIESAE